MLQPGPDLGLTGSKPDSLKRSSLSPPRISAATHTYWISVLPSKQASFQSQSQQKALEIATKGKARAVLRCLLLAGLRVWEGEAYDDAPGERRDP